MNETIKGVYKLDNGNWGYRYASMLDGKKKDIKKTKDDYGKPFTTEKAAARAREAAMAKELMNRTYVPKSKKVTFQDVYAEYCEFGRKSKAYSTIKKQDSLWINHIKPLFGSRFIGDVSVAEINDYLTHLYYVEGRSYQYVEGFLKMFYLIFGQAYARNYLTLDAYNKLCILKEVRIKMPPMKTDEDLEIVAYDREQVAALDAYFEGTNAETAYLLGCYCGLRINECYGLKWENVNIKNGTITIDRQMQYQDGVIKLVTLKTRNARRTVYLNDRLIAYFTKLKNESFS